MRTSRKLTLVMLFTITSFFLLHTLGLCKTDNKLKKSARATRTVEQVLTLYQQVGLTRLKRAFKQANINLPPQELRLLAFKREQRVELWARDYGEWKSIKSYPFTANSGKLGPKLRQGDKQIPEGIYNIIGLNPNSSYHLSMKLNYPNQFDLQHAKLEGRHKPGNNIFIHGKDLSVGCIALGDAAIEELFVIVAMTGKENTQVIISPYDFRDKKLVRSWKSPQWSKALYTNISAALNRLENKQ